MTHGLKISVGGRTNDLANILLERRSGFVDKLDSVLRFAGYDKEGNDFKVYVTKTVAGSHHHQGKLLFSNIQGDFEVLGTYQSEYGNNGERVQFSLKTVNRETSEEFLDKLKRSQTKLEEFVRNNDNNHLMRQAQGNSHNSKPVNASDLVVEMAESVTTAITNTTATQQAIIERVILPLYENQEVLSLVTNALRDMTISEGVEFLTLQKTMEAVQKSLDVTSEMGQKVIDELCDLGIVSKLGTNIKSIYSVKKVEVATPKVVMADTSISEDILLKIPQILEEWDSKNAELSQLLGENSEKETLISRCENTIFNSKKTIEENNSRIEKLRIYINDPKNQKMKDLGLALRQQIAGTMKKKSPFDN